MTAKRWLFFLCAAFVALTQTGQCQEASDWWIYGPADGLAQYACRSVSITPQGTVLALNLNSTTISQLNGYTVSNSPAPASIIGRAEESPGGRLWAMTRQGLEEWQNGAWAFHPVVEIADQFRNAPSDTTRSIPFCPVGRGRVIFLLPDRLMEFSAEEPGHSHTTALRVASRTQIGQFSGMVAAHDGSLWISGMHGLARVPGPAMNPKSGGGWREYILPAALEVRNLREPLEDNQGGIITVGESIASHQRMIVSFDGQKWKTQAVGTEKIQFAWRGPDNVLWAATSEALFRVSGGRLEKVGSEEISASRYFDVATERDGDFWLATSDGLFHYLPALWRSPPALRKISTPVSCLAADSSGRLWFTSAGKLFAFHDNLLQEYHLPDANPRSPQTIHALFPLENGALLLDTGERCLQFQPRDGAFESLQAPETGGQLKPLGTLKDGSVCCQLSVPSGATEKYRLETFDGTRFHPAPFPDPPIKGGFHTVFEAQNGDIWLGGEHGVACSHDKKWQTFVSRGQTVPKSVSGFMELTDGRIWCAAKDEIWEFDKGNWLMVRGGFNHINALVRARDGSIWVASNSGIYHLEKGAWIENGVVEGLPSVSIQQVCKDQNGRIWATTSRGLSLYHPDADPDPPKTFIKRLGNEKGRLYEGDTLSLFFRGRDKWKYTPPERLLYSYRLDQQDWSPFQEVFTVSFSDLAAGKHYFQVRAMDRNGNVESVPAQYDFTVVLPWYKETRLLLIALTGLAAVLFFAALAVNRHRQLLRSYALVEKKIAERTRELEITNRELLHSQKMNALGTLAAGIAHDFNNILSIIKGSAQIIEDNLDNPAKIRTRAGRIKTVVDQGSGIVKAMLGFSRSSDGEPVRCDINDVVDETIKLLGDRFLREVEVRFERAPALPEVSASKDFIQQILLNFIFNAVESLAQHKQVIIATRRITQMPEDIVLPPAPADTCISISVRDFGCGIQPENLLRIFEPFFTTKSLSARRGTGLGLSMVYELAKKMEAGLAVESIAGQGSTFTLILPVRNLPPSSKAETGGTHSAPPQP